jgi:hypothetical protein
MDESLQNGEQDVPEAPENIGNWHLSPEEIKAMDSEQFREFVIDLHVRVGHLYDLEWARMHPQPGVSLTLQDEEHILNPEIVD